MKASRRSWQAEFGRPAVFRISDPEETDRGLKLYGIPSFLDRYLVKKGCRPMERCLCLGTVEGDRDYTRLVKRKIMKVCRGHGALYLTGYASKKWEKTRYTEPYMRETCRITAYRSTPWRPASPGTTSTGSTRG